MTKADAKALSRQRFARFAASYVTSKVHARAPELDRLVEIAQPQPDWNVLDVATGGGHTALRFAPLVARVTATDITPAMLDQARAFITGQGSENVSFELADAEELPFDDGLFDLVTCRIAPHHFPDPARFVCEGARVLKSPDPVRGEPGGLLLVQDLALPEDAAAARYIDTFERLRDPSHHRGYAAGEWGAMFRAAGLEVERQELIVKEHQFIPWARRQGCTPQVIERLVDMVRAASPAVTDWMRPRAWGTPEATFINQHIIIAGRRP